jgi:hypothetical protein
MAACAAVVVLALLACPVAGSGAVPTMIAAMSLRDAASQQSQVQVALQLAQQERDLTREFNELHATEGDHWPPHNTLIRMQAARTRRMVRFRDNDIIIVSYPKVGLGPSSSLLASRRCC